MLSPKQAPREPNFLDTKLIAEAERKAADLDFALQRCCTTPVSLAARQAIKAQVATVITEMLKS